MSYTADDSLAGAGENEGVSEKERTGSVILSQLGPLKFSWCVVIKFDVLLNFSDMEVGGGEDEAVCGDLVTWVHLNDVSNDEVPDGDGLHGALFASVDRDAFLAVLALELDELVVLAVVVPGSDEHLDAEGD